ncbi:glycoside hydrolase family 16 protein [Leifsonia sp. H3M29-4]|uniref:glycoside hydrolase family 16 protein n=1 Tax=Salinibacterium metalliresistens TaxID=3031321 RepID=UPI0023DA1B2D|nr:glycoside hydrolase family 16 protein [Salinibacterium metalliresistens]MDF1478708.1 glycoside hydrolase family 16 protein [Salinibacterium metalliresistens]
MREIHDRFDGPALDARTWLDAYLPHWTTPERSLARYELGGDGIRLRIDADQPAWLPATGLMRVSALQTGTFSGPVGDAVGQDRPRDDLRVVTAVPPRRLWAGRSGRVEVTVSASPDPTCMLGIWLIGEERRPEESGEICIAELFGSSASTVRLGIKPHHDPRLREDVRDIPIDFDFTGPHRYGAQWGDGVSRILIDGEVVAEFRQAPPYPQQLMIALFEFSTDEQRDPVGYPKSATVHAVHAAEES